MEKVTCTIRGVRWADTSDPRNYPYLFGSEMPVQKGLCRYTVEIDLLHAPLPSQLTQEELHVLAQRLQGVRQQAAASYDLDKRIAALQERRRDYEEKRADAEARAEKFRETPNVPTIFPSLSRNGSLVVDTHSAWPSRNVTFSSTATSGCPV